jgi:prepilin-type N-terminal cleavage/methylation domain-containing protein
MKKYLRYLNKRGFSLVELILIVTILAIMATFVTLGARSLIKSATVNNNKKMLRNYFALTKAALDEINNGVSIYGDGAFTSIDDIKQLLKRSTGTEPKQVTRLEDSMDVNNSRPFASQDDGYYVCIRYADPKLTYPVNNIEISEASRSFFVEAVYLVYDSNKDGVCYGCTRSSSTIITYK